MSKTVRVGMVGAGFAASFHLRSYHQVTGISVEIAGLASKTKTRAEQPRRYGFPAS
jgi:predicted dehydrogenase